MKRNFLIIATAILLLGVTMGCTKDIIVTGVTLNKTDITLSVGETENLTAIIFPGNATNQTVNWTSDNSVVATVVNGIVTAKEVGIAIITVLTIDGGYTEKCTVTVTPIKEPEPDLWEGLNPVKTQWGLVINYTASWCVYCGQWGVSYMNNFISKGNVVGIACKASGDISYNSVIFNGFNGDRPTDGYPTFWIGDTESTSSGTLNTLMSRTPTAAFAAKHEIKGDSLIVYAVLNTYSDLASGDYYLSVGVLEDGLHYGQAGISDPDYRHKYVARKQYEDLAYGETTNIQANTTYKYRHAIKLESAWEKSNCYATVVLYKKESGAKPNYKFINGFWTRKTL